MSAITDEYKKLEKELHQKEKDRVRTLVYKYMEKNDRSRAYIARNAGIDYVLFCRFLANANWPFSAKLLQRTERFITSKKETEQ